MQEARKRTRWGEYRRANAERPQAREAELVAAFALLDPQQGEHIWEAGTGNGYLTFPLAQAVGPAGEVVTTDVTEGNVAEVTERNRARSLPIRALLLPLDAPLLGEAYAGAFDAVASIATLHHFDDTSRGGGEEGRRRALRAFRAALHPGGRAVVADVLHGTRTQRYFDAINTPRHCAPHGHPHEFFTEAALRAAAADAGFRNIAIETRFVPWRFASPEEAADFVHTIHNAQCGPEESFAIAKSILGFTQTEDGWELGWELFFLSARA